MDDILDISSADNRHAQFKRRLLRIVVPIACVALLIATIVGIALFNYTSNRKDALALSADLLGSLDREIATEVRAFLSPASDMVKILDGTLRHSPDWANRLVLGEPLAMQMLQAMPQLSLFSFADTQGNYMMLKKMPDQSIHTKFIHREGSSVSVTWVRRSTDGQEIARELSDGDTFDPRTRPWYIGAIDASGVFWTDVYIFFTDKKPGITVSQAFRDEKGELLGVVGLDIELATLSNFLGALKIGRNGRAMIIDDAGRLVAFPEIERMLQQKDGKITASRLNEMKDPVLDRAYNRFLIEKAMHRELIVNGKKYINTISPLKATVGRDWSVLIIVPADDFVGFVSRNYRTALLMSIAVLVLASLLAGLLIWQGLRADRNARLLLSRRKEMETQSQAFSDLAAKPAIFDPTDSAALEELTRITAEAVGVRRVSVWQWQSGRQQLFCSDSYDRESGGHTRGTILFQQDLPQLFEVLQEESPLSIEDAANNPITAELHRVYLKPLGCNNLLSSPVFDQKQSRGVLWFEQEAVGDEWRRESLTFARAVAGLLALRLSAAQGQTSGVPVSDLADGAFETTRPANAVKANDRPPKGILDGTLKPAAHAPPVAMRQTTIVDLRAQAFLKEMKQHTATLDAPGVDLFEDVTVLILQFTDSVALAERLGGEDSMTVVDRLIHHMEKLASESGIEYMKFLSDQLVCAAGFRNDGIVGHAGVTADLALKIQDTCLRILQSSSNILDFRIGIDTGSVIGSMVGGQHKTYNLWGDAVRTAAMMAESGPTGEIHVSESTYRQLQSEYLFKVRGQFYLPKIGELSTYILTGHL